jgi:hypothetical protein
MKGHDPSKTRRTFLRDGALCLAGLGGIHDVTLRAMVEGSGADNNGYGLIEVFSGGGIRLVPGRLQKAYDWTRFEA